MKKYFIVNCGCDDHTEFTMNLTEKELETIIKFIEENNKVADYQCKPEIKIYEYNEGNEDYYDYDDNNCLNKCYEDFK